MQRHRSNGDIQTVMCTSCPTPCNTCAFGGGHPYCRKTPCDCACHKKPEAVPGALSDIYEALGLKDKNVHAAVLEIKRLQKEAKTVAGTRALLMKATSFEFGDGRSITSWWNYPSKRRRYMGVLPGPDNFASFEDLDKALYFVMGKSTDDD